jgi:hypothetical protein
MRMTDDPHAGINARKLITAKIIYVPQTSVIHPRLENGRMSIHAIAHSIAGDMPGIMFDTCIAVKYVRYDSMDGMINLSTEATAIDSINFI